MEREAWRSRSSRSASNPADVLGKYPHQLSGGQLQRLLIARALLLDIRILVADEVISMLDASTRIDVLNLLADLKARGLGVLFITHDLSLGQLPQRPDGHPAPRRDRRDGATRRRCSANPQHPYTQMLLASVPQLLTKWSGERPARGRDRERAAARARGAAARRGGARARRRARRLTPPAVRYETTGSGSGSRPPAIRSRYQK